MIVVDYLVRNKQLLGVTVVLATAVLIFSPYLFLAVPILVLIWILFMWGEKLVYPFVLITFIALPGDIGEGTRTAINVVGSIILVVLMIKKYQFNINRYVKIDRTLFRLIISILSSMIISTLFSTDIIVGAKEVFRQLLFFMIFNLFYSEFIKKGNAFSLLISMVIGGMIISIGICYDLFISGMQLIYLELVGLGKSGGFYNNVSAAGGLLAISLPLSVSFLFLKMDKWSKAKSCVVGVILLQTVALLATNSRGAILSVVVSLLLFGYLLFPIKFKKVFHSILLVISITFLHPTTSELLNLYFRTGRIFENTRYLIWQMAFSIIPDNLLFGVGPGMFKHYMYPNLPVMLGTWNEQQIAYVYENSGAGQAHNFFIMQAVEQGIIGLSISVILLGYVLKTSLKLIKTTHSLSYQDYVLATAIFSIFIGLLSRSFFEATGILTNGWLSRDLPFWLLFLSVLIIKSKTESNTVCKSS